VKSVGMTRIIFYRKGIYPDQFNSGELKSHA
jgi:hypothetical protein